MTHLPFSLPALALGATLVAFTANAHSFSKGDLAIGHPWARETAAGQSAGGGFLTITNKGKAEDRLTGGTTAAAAQVQIHTMSMDGGIMRMRPLKDGLAIPAGGTATLKPGSFHIMFVGLKRPFKQGEMIPVTLTFARAGKVAVQFKVEPITFGGQSHDRH
ncbi:MAG: copper chaperone PCu(A)C [Sphingomonas sp.]|nr:copper chaperone PCu(A)C [Sphingomonas sp.]